MGLLSLGSDDADYDVVQNVVLTVARNWNTYGTNLFGFRVHVDPDILRRCRDKGASILKDHFPEKPGPFKRTAALLVMGRIDPFFHFAAVDNHQPINPHDPKWIARMLALVLPVTLNELRVQVGESGGSPIWEPLNGWRGFPSQHYKFEFLNFVEYMENYDWFERDATESGFFDKVNWPKLTGTRLIRMVMATAMTIEGCYYFNDAGGHDIPSKIRGNCNDFVNPEDIKNIREFCYDSLLAEERDKRRAGG